MFEPEHHYGCTQRHHRVEFKKSRSSARFLSRCLSFFDFFTFIFIFFPEIMLYLPFFLSFKYLEICTGPEFSSTPLVFLSFLRLCLFSFFPFCFFLCCFSFLLFLDCFLDLLRLSLLLELLRLRLEECDEHEEEEDDEEEDEDEDDELEEDDEEDLLRLRFRGLFSCPLLRDLLLSSILELELETFSSSLVDMTTAEND